MSATWSRSTRQLGSVRAGFWRRWTAPLTQRAGGVWGVLLVLASLVLWIGGAGLFVVGEIYALAGLWGLFGASWMYGLLFAKSD
jgi:hypothetical protein